MKILSKKNSHTHPKFATKFCKTLIFLKGKKKGIKVKGERNKNEE